MLKSLAQGTVTALFACLATGAAYPQAYPVKSVRMVVPFPPAGGTDVIARYVAAGMAESLNRQIVVDNRGGANGIIGTEIVARAPADGYTLLFVSSPHSVNPSLYAKLPYDSLRDFAPVSMVATSPYLLVIHPSLPVRSVKELIALARKRPDEIAYASGGTGSSAHLATELFNQMAEVKLREIPYKGAGPALAAVLSGESALVFGNALTVKPHIQSGRLRVLAIASAKRSAATPEIPTIAEAGVPGFQADAVLGLLAPARTPRAIVDPVHPRPGSRLRSRARSDLRLGQRSDSSERIRQRGRGHFPFSFPSTRRGQCCTENWGRESRFTNHDSRS